MPEKLNLSGASGLSNIKRVVVLMFENRSFDHLFGDFPNVNGLFDTNGNFKPECYNLADPLSAPSTSNPQYFPAPVNVSVPLPHDFTHDFGDGMMPDLFGPIFTIDGNPPLPSNSDATYTSGYTANGWVGAISPQPQTYPDTNSGFYTTYNSCKKQEQSALSYFKYGTAKVLHTLAKQYVLCDNFHCDMPGHTLPNRAFIHCATTGDTGIDDPDNGMVNATSLLDLFGQQSGSQQPPTWQMYAPVDSNGTMGQLDTRFLNANLQDCTGASLDQFATDCDNNALPFYSFIMCWTPNTTAYTDTSMHPYSMIQPGENLLAAVYNTLRNSKCWDDTLLIVTFDENGGIYDHVFPPTTTPPDPGADDATQNTTGSCGNKWYLDSTFDFSLLGFRIPALFISPWLSAGIDSTQYQNTSVTRFVIDLMNSIYGTDTGYLTSRDANAPSLDSVFIHYGQTEKRTDCPASIEGYATLPVADPHTNSDAIAHEDGTLKRWAPPAGTESAPPVRYINELLDIYVSALPGHPDTGKRVTRDFATNAEVNAYITEREQAAGVHLSQQTP